ncbi:GNAT family N-acetyltransferase [Pseudoalteromonas sp. T1lg23B]|uniref:GNAT family N-acetyltransferase n=1 Tax=Pseudoalteromonas sp. T1lg23B TaxID=2077097 RepID=UPI000CF69412|nr:GNAT family N-acetyltransferase [Pseudoalteromonas sp. T1lg23B]
MQICLLDPLATPLVNKFYQHHKGRGRATKQDQNWVVKAPDIVAACRVQNKDGELLLSSVLVAEGLRNRGVASALLTQVITAQNTTVYTFAYRHLFEFYQRLGFSRCTLPLKLQPYFNSYVAQKRDIVAMCSSK